MSTLRTNNLQNPDSSNVNIELTQNGGVVVSGILTASSDLNVTSGDAGIGTDSPDSKLHVDSKTTNVPLIVDASQNNRSRIVFKNEYERGTECNVELIDEDLRFVTNSGERLRIKKDGYVGVGLTNPTAKFIVDGGGTSSIALRDDSIENHKRSDDDASITINYRGYQGGTTKFRDLNVYDGKQSLVAQVDGSERRLYVGNTFLESNSIGLGSKTNATRNAGVSTATGTLIYNSDQQGLQVFDGTNWQTVSTVFSATGGSITDVAGYRIHTFTGTQDFQVTAGTKNIDILVQGAGGAGGGRGGNDGSGGGGAGGLQYRTGITVGPGNYTCTVAGGANGVGPATAGNTAGVTNITGLPVGTIQSNGGGGGGSEGPAAVRPGQNGACGGGAGGYSNAYSGGTGEADSGGTDGSTSPSNGWGNDGGANQYPGSPNNNGGGGGGGTQSIGMPGKVPTSVPTQYDMTPLTGNGGNGLQYSISGAPVYYGGGGGCGGNSHPGTNNNPGAYGGRGGGGNGGGGPFGVASNGAPGTGGGGGGAAANNSPTTPHNSGNGGGGVVIIRYSI